MSSTNRLVGWYQGSFFGWVVAIDYSRLHFHVCNHVALEKR